MTYIRSYMPGHRAFIAPCVQHRRASVSPAASSAPNSRAESTTVTPVEARSGGGSKS